MTLRKSARADLRWLARLKRPGKHLRVTVNKHLRVTVKESRRGNNLWPTQSENAPISDSFISDL
jgi:hypothetical protein